MQAGTTLSDTLLAVERCGPMTGPLSRRLLGSETPVRAFVGHVEPTFNWTLRAPDTGQAIAHHIVDSLYNQLHLAARPPVGLAMTTYYSNVGGLLKDHLQEVDGGQPARGRGVGSGDTGKAGRARIAWQR